MPRCWLTTGTTSLSCPTATSLRISATAVAHGTPVTLNADVAHSLGTEAPSGAVSIFTSFPLPSNQGQDLLPLNTNGSATATIDSLPGGTYQLHANYPGDGIYSANVSTAHNHQCDSRSQRHRDFRGANVRCARSQQHTCLLRRGRSVYRRGCRRCHHRRRRRALAKCAARWSRLRSHEGDRFRLLQSRWPGHGPRPSQRTRHRYLDHPRHSHRRSSLGSGRLLRGRKLRCVSIRPFHLHRAEGTNHPPSRPRWRLWFRDHMHRRCGGPLPRSEVYLRGTGCLPLSGSATVTLGLQTQTVTLTQAGSEGPYATPILTGIASFGNLQPGAYSLTAAYTGDGDYQPASLSPGFNVAIVPSTGPRIPTTTLLSGAASTHTYNQDAAALAVTVTGGSASGGSSGAPTGIVTVYANGQGLATISLAQAVPHNASRTSAPLLSSYYNLGLNEVTAVYSGDAVYRQSVSAPMPLSVVLPGTSGFTLTPTATQLDVRAGSSSSTSIDLASLLGFHDTVGLSCKTSANSIGCAISPASVMLNGASSATLTVTTAFDQPCSGQPEPVLGTYSVIVTGASSTIVRSAELTIIVDGSHNPAKPQFEQPNGVGCPLSNMHSEALRPSPRATPFLVRARFRSLQSKYPTLRISHLRQPLSFHIQGLQPPLC